MGASVVKHLIKAGHELFLYTRTAEKAAPLIELGAVWLESPKLVAEKAEVIFTMVGYPKDVEEVYFGDNGILHHAKDGAVVVDMTTSQPVLAERIYKEAVKNGVQSLDAPVSGGDIGAQNGTLSIMVGGEREVFDELAPIFDLFGNTVVYHGEAGAGQHAKMCNQIVVASNMIAVCEALIYAKKAGLDQEEMLRSVTTGAAGSWALSNLAPRIIKGDYAPGFYIKHFVKDMRIACEEADRLDLDLPGLKLTLSKYEQLEDEGHGDKGTQALYELYDR